LARLNHLPASTLTTTPHLLHTRRYLTLPANARILFSILNHNYASTNNDDDDTELLVLGREKERERARALARERAEKRFAFVTKEVDYRVAKAYVAIADEFGDDESDFPRGEIANEREEKKEKKFWTTTEDGRVGGRGSNRSLEARAIDRYLDDEEWEQQELKAGRSSRLPSFALGILRDGL
jgi:hypothetical protein